jgi:hypothetical protein
MEKHRLGGDVLDEEHQAAIEVDLALYHFLVELERLGYWKLCVPCHSGFVVSITRTPLGRRLPVTWRHRVVAGLYRLIDKLTPYTPLPDNGGHINNSAVR